MSDTILITGGASGIGKAICHLFSKHNFQIILIDIDEANGQKVSNETNASFYKCDVTDRMAVQTVASSLQGTNIKHLISCAGRALPDEFETTIPDITTWDSSVSLNLNSHYYVTHAFLDMLKPTIGDKSITYISSINAIQGFGLIAYSAAKAGLLGLTQSLSVPLGKENNIRVNSVLPGTVRPSKKEKLENKDYASLTQGTILGKMAEEDDIAQTVLSLTTQMLHVTGQSIVVDGGQTILR